MLTCRQIEARSTCSTDQHQTHTKSVSHLCPITCVIKPKSEFMRQGETGFLILICLQQFHVVVLQLHICFPSQHSTVHCFNCPLLPPPPTYSSEPCHFMLTSVLSPAEFSRLLQQSRTCLDYRVSKQTRGNAVCQNSLRDFFFSFKHRRAKLAYKAFSCLAA